MQIEKTEKLHVDSSSDESCSIDDDEPKRRRKRVRKSATATATATGDFHSGDWMTKLVEAIKSTGPTSASSSSSHIDANTLRALELENEKLKLEKTILELKIQQK